ncbi:hypothetical protein ACVW01_002693, partial [Thermostichus sp. MS-CIW-19]
SAAEAPDATAAPPPPRPTEGSGGASQGGLG